MDGGFKRLWMRKRNKSGASVQRSTPVNDASMSHSRPSMSTIDGRPSIALSSNPPDGSSSQDRIGSSRDYTSVASDEYSHPKSGHRIQPILVGISRPAQHYDRPATAGSLQNAVQQAADLPGRKSAELLSSQNGPTSYHKRAQSPRYVDIFAVASSIPSYNSRFNEEIAERNLDVLRMAMEDEQAGYVPSSKYQEEVANRNADLSRNARVSEEHGRRSTDQNRYLGSPGKKGRQAGNFQPSEHQRQQSSNAREIPNGTLQQSIGYHMRPQSQRSNDPGLQSSALLHGRYIEASQKPIETNEDVRPNSSSSQSKPASHGQSHTHMTMYTIDEKPGHYDYASTNHRFKNQSYGAPITSSKDKHMDYTLSISELGGRAQARQLPSRSSDLDHPSERRYIDSSVRAASATSTRSYKRSINLQNRTIMDLTGEDDAISETSSSTYGSENTPVLEQAQWDSIQRIIPQQTSTYDKVTTEEATPTPQTYNIPSDPRQYESQPLESASPSISKPAVQSSKIAFSPINTLASVTPRSSMIVQKEQPMTMVQRVTAALEARNGNSTLQPAPATGAVQSEGLLNAEAPPEDAQSGQSTPKAGALNAARAVKHLPTIEPLEQLSPLPKIEVISDAAIASQPQEISTTPIRQTVPSVYESPQNLNSIDSKSPSDSFGVRTRDFAITPKKSATSLKKSESRSLQKSATENAAKAAGLGQKKTPSTSSSSRSKPGTPSTRKVSSTGFDEEAFARKQADARAALERLQQSLKEDFTTPVPAEPSKNRTSYGSDTDGRPVAPVSIPSPSRNVSRANSSVQRADLEKPPSSYRGPAFEPVRMSSMSSSRSRSGGRTPRKTAPPSLKNVDAASTPINIAQLPPSLLHILETSSKPPRSPGEISLSSFPLPTSRPTSEHEHGNGSQMGPSILTHMRRDSSKSQASMASQFSIPFHMIPDRSSSVRETVDEEDEDGYSV